MGMASESVHADYAKDLEKILFAAATNSDLNYELSVIIPIMKQEIYPLYKEVCDNSYGIHKIDPKLKELYENDKII